MFKTKQKWKIIWTMASFLLIPMIGIIDYLSGPEFTFSLIYLIPVSLAAWFVNKPIAISASFFSVIIWLLVDFDTGRYFHDWTAYIWNFCSRLAVLIIIGWLLLLQRDALRREGELSRIDYLTHAFNSRAFYEIAELELNRSGRYQHPLTLAYLDIDNFKLVNDTVGHLAGDKLLRTVVEIVKHNLRKCDTVARVGGDEFALLLPETDQEAAVRVITKLQNHLVGKMSDNKWPVTFSIGVITCVQMPPSVDRLIDLGDQLMYTIKQNGKNGVIYSTYPVEMQQVQT